MLEYETANPGADFDEHEQQHFDPHIHGSRPPTIVNIQPPTSSSSGENSIKQDDEIKTITGPEADHYDPDGVKASPGNHTAGKGRHRRMSALRGARKEAGFSPTEEASRKEEMGERTDVYDAAPGAERGRA